MGLLDKLKGKTVGLIRGAREVREDLREVVHLLRHRTGEQVAVAMARRETAPIEIRNGSVDIGMGIIVRQKDEDTICVGAKEFSCEELAGFAQGPDLTQDDLNLDFLPFGWSCRLGSGGDTLFVTAYEGRNLGPKHGNKILVVKNSAGKILKVIHPAPAEATERIFGDSVLLEKDIMIRKTDSGTIDVGGRPVTHKKLMELISPLTRISCDAHGVTEAIILRDNNKLDWSCTLGEGNNLLTLTAYESTDKRKRCMIVIQDSKGVIRAEVLPFMWESLARH